MLPKIKTLTWLIFHSQQIPPPKTGNLVELFNVKVGAWVMLTTNIDVGDGLTNGAMGTVSAVILNRNKRIHAVLVVFDSEKIGVYAKGNSWNINILTVVLYQFKGLRYHLVLNTVSM